MNKKLLSMTLALSMVAAGAAAVMADDKAPTVYVDKSEIIFEDQEPVILGEGFTVVPVRGVFEAMGATVKWKEETKQVEVTSADNNTVIRLFIDDNTMRIFDMSGMMGTLIQGEDFHAPEKDVTLDVAPQIIGDRTMIPLRAISEALQTEVKWDGEAYTINIETGNAPADTTGLPEYSLSADKLTAAAGETVDLYINVKNMPEGMYVSGVSAAVKFDPTAFEFVDAALVNGDKAIEGALGASNPEFTMPGLMKAAFVTVNAETAAQADGAVMKLTFKSINGKEGSFSISDSYHTKLGHSTELYVDVVKSDDDKAKKSVTYKGNDLVINATPVVINAAGSTAEPTATPAATATPEATAEPTATPDATATPEATAEPTATPDATATPEATVEPTATPAA
ncbi:hypothetical protein FMM68_07365 [Lachnospiraceae bacterium MD329]|nr:hypothetical protein [Lachnospiraceae bacterium MD329]